MAVQFQRHVSTKRTPQSEPILGTTQVENNAGGYSWAVGDWVRLDRFLVLGTEGGTYYTNEHKLTRDAAAAVFRCIEADGPRTVRRIVEISQAGRAPKNDPALFALALCASATSQATRRIALENLPHVARIATHLFTFLTYVQEFRGWGRALRNATARWYEDKTVEALAYQMVKYRQRGGWTHRDVLRKSHPDVPKHRALFDWATHGKVTAKLPQIVSDFIVLQSADLKTAVRLIAENPSLTWEMVPSEILGKRDIWAALLPNMPMTAMIRNLGRMTANGLIMPLSDATTSAVAKLSDEAAIRKARVHPISVLAALSTYALGHGVRGSLMWAPVSQVIDALDAAFYTAFGNVEPSGARHVLALDVSGSMSWGEVSGVPGLTPLIAAAAMSLVTAATEPAVTTVAFSHEMVPLPISPRERIDDVMRRTRGLPFGGTDCALPMIWARQEGVRADVFVIYTDSETWCGNIHPVQALRDYRASMGIPAKLVVVGMEGNDFTIADPEDAGMLDVVGFDTATPQVISDFTAQAVTQ